MRIRHVLPILLLPLAALAGPAPTPTPDTRVPIALTAAERDYVLAGMREHVGEIQDIVDALAAHDSARAQAMALHAGTKRFAALTDHPPGLGAKWPAPWKQLLRARLEGFDALAQGIADGEDPARSLQRLSTAMQACVACHATYRLTVAHE